ncbi:MAG: imidazole glycerol phosphate synthase subunit HisH [Candidatus Omnitrophica bacterium]|nr:imidazole glycerol phosphate synthase subunit HisH [Candidatus Omnitrophota bacterium]MBU1869732.1 imidazole glycerol phosphate synthase subunit HisH [Candidatus Omnitrophota bacterium]
MIAIIDYGMGNIHSVAKALEVFGAKVIVTNKAKDILSSDKAVLPGVGAFDDAMLELKKQALIPVLKDFVKSAKPFLGICLGMQLLFEESEEALNSKGLGLFKGKVVKFKREGLKVPHMGWNQIKIKNKGCLLLKDIPDNSYVYFCHSYYPVLEDDEVMAAACNYGHDFAAAVCRGNIFGVQFHPEKSQVVGLKMMQNFVKLC